MITLWLACLSVAAAERPPPRFELTPYAAYRIGGEFEQEGGDEAFELDEGDAQGLVFNVRAAADTQWEVLYARQRTELETQASFAGEPLLDIGVDYLHFGGTYLFAGESTRPFLALTVGISRFEPGLGELDAESYLSASMGGGVHLRANRPIGVRLEGRVFASLIDSDGDLFCLASREANVCAIVVDGKTLVQWEARAGLVFRF